MEEERRNLNQDDVLDLIGKFPLQPRFNGVYLTSNKIDINSTLNISDTVLDEVQYVIAVGPVVTDLQPGQKVILDIEKMMVDIRSESVNSYESYKQVKLDLMQYNGDVFALVSDRVIKTIDNR